MARIPIVENLFSKYENREIVCTNNLFGNFLVEKGLYDEIEITYENINQLADLIGGHVKIDIYCPECKECRVFTCESIPYYFYDDHNDEIIARNLEDEIISWKHIQEDAPTRSLDGSLLNWNWTNNSIFEHTRVMVFKFVCAMDSNHRLDYVVLADGNKLKKIGQYPSVADLSFPEIKEYRKVMTTEDEKELKRAIGLFASGIGVGSFVYLRRIFERIIFVTSQKAIEDGKIDAESYNKARVEERINMLADYLPKSLIENAVFYGIISKGIHELSEEECIEYFPVMKSFITMILRQWIDIQKEAEEEKKLSAALSKIASNLKK